MLKQHKITAIISAVAALLLAAVVVLTCLLIAAGRNAGGASSLSPHEEYYNNKCLSYSVQNVNLAKGQIVFVGDSITDLYVLDDYYADLPRATYNRGIGGDTTAGVLERLDVSIFDIAPSAVVLMIGTNDVNGGHDNDVIMDRYEEILDKIYAALPDVKLYCMSVIPQNDQLEEYTAINVDETTEKIQNLNPRIKALAESRGATYLDLFPLLADENDRLIRKYSDDGIHLNAAGFEVWTGLLKPYLAK